MSKNVKFRLLRKGRLENRGVAGPLNDPLIEAYEHLHARLTLEMNTTEDLNERMALSQAARALVNAIETERLIRGPYQR